MVAFVGHRQARDLGGHEAAVAAIRVVADQEVEVVVRLLLGGVEEARHLSRSALRLGIERSVRLSLRAHRAVVRARVVPAEYGVEDRAGEPNARGRLWRTRSSPRCGPSRRSARRRSGVDEPRRNSGRNAEPSFSSDSPRSFVSTARYVFPWKTNVTGGPTAAPCSCIRAAAVIPRIRRCLRGGLGGVPRTEARAPAHRKNTTAAAPAKQRRGIRGNANAYATSTPSFPFQNVSETITKTRHVQRNLSIGWPPEHSVPDESRVARWDGAIPPYPHDTYPRNLAPAQEIVRSWQPRQVDPRWRRPGGVFENLHFQECQSPVHRDPLTASMARNPGHARRVRYNLWSGGHIALCGTAPVRVSRSARVAVRLPRRRPAA